MNEDQNHKTQWLAPLVLEGGVSVQFRDHHVHVQLGTDLKVSSEKRNLIWGLIGRA
ncbi:MAG: hypothetical protein AB7Q37_12605 [Pyrinomonadaceae bacterium]